MSELSRFLPEDQDLLIGLFYRIGCWMSDIDDTDTDDTSERMEEKQLNAVLEKLAKSERAGALCSELAAEALRQKSNRKRWESAADKVLDDVVRAKAVIKGQGTAQEFQLFGKSLVTIATAVARAYREAEDVEREELGFLSWLTEKSTNISLALSDGEAYKDMNISPAEDTALNDLVAALKS